ncbi:MAG: hypothetical protein GY869_23535, partial [Planctomycetes bacterium]|nr:hypothetical protein [Planctomycetota bacterium]
ESKHRTGPVPSCKPPWFVAGYENYLAAKRKFSGNGVKSLDRWVGLLYLLWKISCITSSFELPDQVYKNDCNTGAQNQKAEKNDNRVCSSRKGNGQCASKKNNEPDPPYPFRFFLIVKHCAYLALTRHEARYLSADFRCQRDLIAGFAIDLWYKKPAATEIII